MSLIDLFTHLEMRAHLKRYAKSGEVVQVQMGGHVTLCMKVVSVGFGTFVYDLYDHDEETWLSTRRTQISDVVDICDTSIERARMKLEMQAIEDEGMGEDPAGRRKAIDFAFEATGEDYEISDATIDRFIEDEFGAQDDDEDDPLGV